MLTRVKEMIDALNARPNASTGFTAKEVYEVGQTYGLTCREIGQTFLGKSKAIGYSRYLPQMPPSEVLEAALNAGPKKRGRKTGVAKKTVAKKVVEQEMSEESLEEAPQVDTPAVDGEVSCWIATPEEMNEDLDIAPTPKPKRASKPRKVKVS